MQQKLPRESAECEKLLLDLMRWNRESQNLRLESITQRSVTIVSVAASIGAGISVVLLTHFVDSIDVCELSIASLVSAGASIIFALSTLGFGVKGILPIRAREKETRLIGWRNDPDPSFFLQTCIDYPLYGPHKWTANQMLEAWKSNEDTIDKAAMRLFLGKCISIGTMCVSRRFCDLRTFLGGTPLRSNILRVSCFDQWPVRRLSLARVALGLILIRLRLLFSRLGSRLVI